MSPYSFYFSFKKKKRTKWFLYNPIGGAEEDRTLYLLNANQALSQVSYSPNIFNAFLLYAYVKRKSTNFYKKGKKSNFANQNVSKL